jgi:cytoskeletal protein CcmA (bactofilin family)
MATNEITSTIGRGTVVRGSVHGEGDLEILGRVEGSVAIGGELTIGETALVKSDVSGRRVIVRGAVAGNVTATEAIVLEAGARVVGDLGAPQIGIRPGALVRGLVSTHGAGTSAPRARAAEAPAARPAAPPTRAPARAAAAVKMGETPKPPAQPLKTAETPKPPAQSARPAPAPAARPAAPKPTARSEATTITSPRVEAPARHTPKPEAVERAREPEPEEAVAHAGHDGHGPPPPVVPQIRKGAKASLRRKAR